MLHAPIAWLLLAASGSEPPRLVNDPPPKAETPTIVQISGIENEVVTITVKAGEKLKYDSVMTPDGPRIRLTCGLVEVQASRLRLQVDQTLWSMKAIDVGDGKRAVIELNVTDVPHVAPMPRLKRP